jgi:hypothetical protein
LVFLSTILPGSSQAAYHFPRHLRQRDLGRMLKTSKSVSRDEPGRSIKLRSATSGPVIWRTIRLAEKERSAAASGPERKAFGGADGLKIALCALRTRSVTSDLLVMGCPNWIFWEFARTLPSAAVFNCNQTVHVHGPSEHAS